MWIAEFRVWTERIVVRASRLHRGQGGLAKTADVPAPLLEQAALYTAPFRLWGKREKSCQQLFDDIPLDIGQPEVAPLEAIG